MWRKNDAFLKAVNQIDSEFQRWSQNDNVGVVMIVVVVMMVLDFAVMMTMIIVIMMVTSAGTWGPCGATLLCPVQPLQSLTFFSKPKPSHSV